MSFVLGPIFPCMARGKTSGGERAAFLKGALDLLVLEVLRAGRLHGFAIARAVQERSDGEILLEEGTLYPALHRLERHGWLEASWGTSENGRRARFYALTQAGKKERLRRSRSWSRFAGAMDRVLGSAQPRDAAGGSR